MGCSALLPRQTAKTPSAGGAAMVLIIPFSFKSLSDMKDIIQAGLLQLDPGHQRAFTAAADQDDWRSAGFSASLCAAKHQFSDIRHKVWIDVPVRLIDPGDVYSAGGMADE